MSKLEQLISELCPDGVEYRTISEVCNTITPPIKIPTNKTSVKGKYPVIDQGLEYIRGYTDDSKAVLLGKEYIVFGDHTETIKFVNFQFAQGADGIKILTTLNDVPKYIYYCFQTFYTKTGKYTRHWSAAKTTLIPLPPLPVQREIVRILDNFTELTARKKTV